MNRLLRCPRRRRPRAPRAGASAAKFKFFKTPSGNIGCAMGGGAVRCDIKQKSWEAPPKPS